jgi:hypothetical protein
VGVEGSEAVNGGVTQGQAMFWFNPATKMVVQSVGGTFDHYNETSVPTCPGYRATIVNAWQVWSERKMETGPPFLNVSFGGK